MKVQKVLGFQVLKDDAPAVPTLQYQVIGTRQDAYLMHPISQPPDFDHILRLDLSQSTLTDEDIGAGVTVTIDGRGNRVEERLHEGRVTATVNGTDRQVVLQVDKVLSTLVGPDFVKGPKA